MSKRLLLLFSNFKLIKAYTKSRNLVFKNNISIMPKKPKYFTSNEVAIHNTAKDIWLSFLGKVYDLTAFVEANAG